MPDNNIPVVRRRTIDSLQNRAATRTGSIALVSLIFLLAAAFLVSCKDEPAPTLVSTAESPVVVATVQGTQIEESSEVVAATQSPATPTNVPPTATPEPLAATVNGKPVLLADFEKEVGRFQKAQEELGLTSSNSNDYTGIVLEVLIETEIIAQAAEAMGIQVTNQMVTERIDELKQSSGGEESFSTWLQANQWSEEEFHQALWTEMVTEQAVALVTADVPFAVEQVHARYIQVEDADLAQSLLEQARNGEDFAALAQQYSIDRMTGEDGGDLGYFAQGSLLVPEVEIAAFALQPGQISEVVVATRADGSGTAFYLVQLIERDPQREITANLRSNLLRETFELWLAEQWNLAEVERFVVENQ